MNKIIYLLGAGSSFYSIPLVNEWSTSYKTVIRETDKFKGLIEEVRAYQTIDTYLKIIHSQMITAGKESPAYTQLENKYNLCLDLIKRFIDHYSTEEPTPANRRSRAKIVFPFNRESNSLHDQENKKKFNNFLKSIIRVNNTSIDKRIVSFASEIYDSLENFAIYTWNYDTLLQDSLQYIKNGPEGSIRYLNGNIKDNKVKLAFEYETQDYSNLIITEDFISTDTLIIIGYSFPYYNHKVDQFILNLFLGKNTNKEKMIIIQDINADAIEEMLTLNLKRNITFSHLLNQGKIKIKTLKNCERFYVPI